MASPAWNVTASVVADEDDSRRVGIIAFTFRRDGLVATVVFSDPDGAAAGDWNALLTPGGHTYEFCSSSNGSVSIHSNGSAITFEVSKYGDGMIKVTAPVEACRAAIESVKQRVAEIQRRRVK